MTKRTQYIVSAALVTGAIAAVALSSTRAPAAGSAEPAHDHAAMSSDAAADTGSILLDPESARRIGVTYVTAQVGALDRRVQTVGVVTFDDARVTTVSPKIEGWVEQLYVDFTGAPVRKGQPLMAVYSPMLVAAQEELVLAAQMARTATTGQAGENARELLNAARRRLSYWDISQSEIAAIERSGVAQRTVILRAPGGGVVVDKNVLRGARIMPGMDLYRIADLSTVWIEGEVFERDLGLVRVGTAAQVTLDAYAGEVFTGRVTLIHPTVSAETRTGRIRIELANPGLRLKPGMYANVQFDVSVHMSGLHVPRTAVLTTGTRSLVFLRRADGRLAPQQVRTGQAAGDHVEILAGLAEGDEVVESASFLVDAESNLGAAMRGMTQATDGAGGAKPDVPTGHTGH